MSGSQFDPAAYSEPQPPPVYDPPENTGRHRRRFRVILWTVLILVVALAAWFAVLVAFRDGHGLFSSPEQYVAQQMVKVMNDRVRVADIVSEPSGWSKGLQLPGTISQIGGVQDTSTGDIAVTSVLDGKTWKLVGVDVGLSKVLWSVAAKAYWGTLSTGQGVISDPNGRFYFVDVNTGKTTPLVAVRGDDRVVSVGPDGMVNFSPATGHYCDIVYTDPIHCKWEAAAMTLGEPDVFGHWINTAVGVYDLITGKPADFGSDASEDVDAKSAVFYAGTESAVVRVVQDSTGTIIQPWNTTTNKGASDPVTIEGKPLSADWNTPSLLTYDVGKQAASILRAYSWQTGEKLWETSVKIIDGTPQLDASEHNFQFSMTKYSKAKYPDRPKAAILDWATGTLLRTSNTVDMIDAGQRVVYTYSTSKKNGVVLHAIDSQAEDAAELWSIAAPDASTGSYYLVANRLIEITDTGKLFILQK